MRGLLFGATLLLAGAALADEITMPIASEGEWMAVAHRVSQLAPPDMCMAGNAGSGLYFRIDGLTTEVRVADRTWSLPKNVAGSIALGAGKVSLVLDISGNTDQMVLAEISKSDLVGLLDAMDKEGVMAVTVGKERARSVSLSGSTKVTNAFRVCARLPGNAPGAGNNPFK